MTDPKPAAANDPQLAPLTDYEYEEMLHDDALAALALEYEDFETDSQHAEETIDALALDGDVAGAVRLSLARAVLSDADATPGTTLRVMTSQSRGPEIDALLTSLYVLLDATTGSADPAIRQAALEVGVFASDVEGLEVCCCCRAKAEAGAELAAERELS